ncbi:MAG: hypothetical protein MUO40_01115 [Anaerolineaceae bacterium]|nr:hypothetical protein [Anaerolineaceae bacterium]
MPKIRNSDYDKILFMTFLDKSVKFLVRVGRILFLLVISSIILVRSAIPWGDEVEQIRVLTREKEFNFVDWTLNALGMKSIQVSLNLEKFIKTEKENELVQEYLEQVVLVQRMNNSLELIYSDPQTKDPESAGKELIESIKTEQARLDDLSVLAETILQDQVAEILVDLNLDFAGEIIPPVAYHVSELPLALVVSPRDEIRRITDISLETKFSAKDKAELEDSVTEELNLSALVVPIGGLSAYPTMVMQSSDLSWLVEAIGHEWVHNYLSAQPIGINYGASSEMRSINETTASLAGAEISHALLSKYYPDLLPKPIDQPPSPTEDIPLDAPPSFNFREEMRITRVAVDSFLEQGMIEEAEEYMEQRRQFFWDNGYLIRKINQAYFAFYGAYNDQPGGGASGNDPVGPMVRLLREKSENLSEFLKKIARVNSFPSLQNLVKDQ